MICFLVLLSALQSLTFALFQKKYNGNSTLATGVFSVLEGIFVPLFTVIWLMFDINANASGFSVQYAGLNFNVSFFTLLIAIFNATALFFYNMFFIKASSTGSFAFVNVIMLFGAILIPTLYSALFNNETVLPHQIIGIALMVCSFVIMNYKDFNFKDTKWVYFLYCFLLFIVNGAYSTFLKVQSIFKQSEYNEMILLTYAFMGVLALAKILITEKKDAIRALKINKQAIIPLVAGIFVVAFTTNFFKFALSLINTAVLYSALNGGVIVLTTIFSIMFFKEKIQTNKIVGIIIAIFSIILLTISV